MGILSQSMRRLVLIFLAGSVVCWATACTRWLQVRTYQVNHQADPALSFQAVEDVVQAENYQILERNTSARSVKLRSHIDESSESRVSLITVKVSDTGQVMLTPSGFLVREDGSIHKRFHEELVDLEQRIAGRLAGESEQPAPTATSTGLSAVPELPPTPAESLPQAWSEPSSDPAKWGPGNFTCLPVNILASEQAAIALRLSTGEQAKLSLSLAYDATLCRSPTACPHQGGCPALGIGDAEQVRVLALRLQSKELASTATLLHRGEPAAIVDLSRHGSVMQALGQAAPTRAPNE